MIELIETKTAMRNYSNSLPLHNESIIEADQNSDNEIAITTITGNELKSYTLKSSWVDVFEWVWGVSPGNINPNDFLTIEDYINYSKHFRKDWVEVQE